ncbi:MAG TPA: FxLYD domain-containing protein [Candidatus Methylomirabilis sp.]|nr:FxLYD domain-containing protein [Candidatus Methylomirabilis sp.]
MTRRLLLLGLLFALAPSALFAQTYTPQSPAGLSVSFTTERAGGTRVLVFGEVRNTNPSSAQHVVVVVEGLDESGRVVSRAHGNVLGLVPPRGTAPFEIRMLASGSEKRYRMQIESFEFIVGGGGGGGAAPRPPREAQSP